MTKQSKCRECGTTNVEWRQSKAGKWYLADINRGARGSRVFAGPHFKSCAADRNAAVAAHNAKVQAERDAHQAKMEAFAAAQDWDGLRNYIEGVA
jgi:hypothetical protein